MNALGVEGTELRLAASRAGGLLAAWLEGPRVPFTFYGAFGSRTVSRLDGQRVRLRLLAPQSVK